ncbi:MAG: TIGR03663 family protein [Planctomycetes bacterium]|nr:TIGR03663 family protein [Planctomycetota bacterium]MBL7037542.1 TIGR03663 family protein [Pirellulaceae bacterium]
MAPFSFGVLLFIVAGAAVPRLAKLDNRPMHCDEAVHAIKFGRLLEDDDYVYDPHEYHGPSLNFLALPIAWLVSAERLTEITETHLRLLPAVFGIAIVGAVWRLRRELGYAAALCAAALTAVSPAMVFYSRYYIQEMLLVVFTFGAIIAVWRFVRAEQVSETPSWFTRFVIPGLWLTVGGVCVGMMHASKETCVIHLFAMFVAFGTLIVARRITDRSAASSQQHRKQTAADSWFPTEVSLRRVAIPATLMAVTALIASAIFFSSFLDNPRGVVDSFTTYFHYLGRASGEGTTGRHVQDWDYYFRILFWWHRGDFVWSEAPIALLAVVGLVAAVVGKGVKPDQLPMARFLGVYTIVMTGVYSVLPYKTPWCALGLLHGMILLGGIGTVVLVRLTPTHVGKALMVITLVGAAGLLGYQAYRASFVAFEHQDNPHVYAHTTNDVPVLVERVTQLAGAHPDGDNVHVEVICPEDDYWPLPWYLRNFPNVGWHGDVPTGPGAPLIITQPSMEAGLLKRLFEDQPPGQQHLYVPVLRDDKLQEWELRPHVPLRVYVRLDLWDAFQAKDDTASWDGR